MQTKKDLYGIVRPRGISCDEWVHKYIEDEVKGKAQGHQSTLYRLFKACGPPAG